MPAPNPSRRLVPDLWVRSWPVGMALLTVLVAACAVPTVGPDPAAAAVPPEIYELANIRPCYVVPKSSPATLVATFEKYCLDGSHDPARVAGALRAADFVAVPRAEQATVTSFVVDESRPLVMLSDDGRACAVGAVARTGQFARIQSMIASRFPGAQPLDRSTAGVETELAVQVTGSNAGVIFVSRLAPTISNSRLILGILRQG